MSPDGKSWLYDRHRYTIVDQAALGSQSVGVNTCYASVSTTVNQNEMLIRCVTRAELEGPAE